MVDAELVQHGGVQVVHGGYLVDGGVTEFIGLAVDDATLDASPGHPDGHGLAVMVTAAAALRHRGATEFTSPHDQGVVEHPALLKVGDERHAGAVDFGSLERDAILDAAMVIPVFMVELDEAHTALGKATGEQAVGRERTVTGHATVEREGLGVFGRDVHELGHAGLHLEGHFILGDTRGDLGVGDDFVAMEIKGRDGVDVAALGIARDSRRVGEVHHGVSLGA